MKVFISGSISIKNLPISVKDSINKIIEKKGEILVGDAQGIDTYVQNYCLQCGYGNVTVYSITDPPRYRASETFASVKVDVREEKQKEREKQKQKDKVMTENSDYCLVVWDGKSPGSYENITRAIDSKKKIRIYLLSRQSFLAQEQINKNEIEYIFRENNGYAASEVIELLRENVTQYFTKAQDLNRYLAKKLIIKKEGNGYSPSSAFAHLFIIQKYKGKPTGIRFKNEFISWIEERVKLRELPGREEEQLELSFE